MNLAPRAKNEPSSSRNSPPPPGDPPRPAKRSRKAINCEPCRASKLKCDRARPCSGCVLRGTVALCYADSKHDGTSGEGGPDEGPRYDPHGEISRIRQSLSILEAHITRSAAAAVAAAASSAAQAQADASARQAPPAPPPLKIPSFEPDVNHDALGQDLLARQSEGGNLYAGTTSAATLLGFKHDKEPETGPSEEFRFDVQQNYDLVSLINALPDVPVVDGLLHHYFESCTWLYRHLSPSAFAHAWARFKSGTQTDPIILATVYIALAISIQYIPPRHPLLGSLPDAPVRLSEQYYTWGCNALVHHQAVRRLPSLELVEMLLLRMHYLSVAKTDCEEIWRVRGELVSSALAMGLHRDPKKWRMARDVSERRRWAWWNVVFCERWQAFMFGRPPAIANHHFDTQFPSDDYTDSSGQPAGRSHLPFLHVFRLAHIIGDIMDDAVSVRPVSYDRVLGHDRSITVWLETLPPEMDMDDYRLARALSSPALPLRRMGVQSLCIRSAMHHVRFTLHRPFTTPQGRQDPRTSQSFEAAVAAADRLIHLLTQSRPDFLANSSLAVPGQIPWAPFHVFSAAVFFSCQLIAKPDQAGTHLFRANISRVMAALESLRDTLPVATKALLVLQALAPMYDEHYPLDAERRNECLAVLRRLQFPNDTPGQRSPSSLSPTTMGMSSPATLAHPHPQLHHHHQTQHPMGIPYHPSPSTPAGLPPNSEDALWSASMGLESNDWASFLQSVVRGVAPPQAAVPQGFAS